MRPRLLAAWSSGLVLLLAIPAFVIANLGDVATVDDEDLTSLPPPVPEQRNGHPSLRAAIDVLDWPEDESAVRAHLDGETWDPGLVRELVERNADALAHLGASLEAPAFRGPVLRDIEDDPSEVLAGAPRLTRAAGLRALARARRGDAKGAAADALAAIRLGRRLEADPGGGLVHAMVAVAVKEIGARALATGLPHLEPSAARSRAWAAELAALGTDPEGWRATWATEYRLMRAAVEEMAAGLEAGGAEPPPLTDPEAWALRLGPVSYHFKPRATLRLLADRYRAFQASADRPCAELPPPPRRPRGPRLWLSMLGPNGMGRLAVTVGTPDLRRFEMRRCAIDSRLAMLRALVGLRAFAADHGRLPETLEALVPRYLDAVPRDAFDGAPIRYAARVERLWSVGSDLRDAGGRGPEDDPLLREPWMAIRF